MAEIKISGRKLVGQTIVLTSRSDDIVACIQDEPRCWGRGQTPNEAIGDLIRTHPEMFGVKLDTTNLKSA